MTPYSPATRDEAVALVASQAPTFPITSQGRLFDRSSLETLSDRGARRPDLVSAARERGHVLGLIGARLAGEGFGLVDLLALPALPGASDALIDAVTGCARSLGTAEVSFGAPPAERPLEVPAVRAVVEAFVAHGWRVLVTRRRVAVHRGAARGRPDRVCPVRRGRPTARTPGS